MPNLVYSNGVFIPFTKISSSVMNQYFADIKSRLNWSGGTDATTGLGDSNIQSAAVSGGALTRATKLKAGTANYVVVNDGTGAMSETAQISFTQGGTGLNIVPGNQQPGDVIQVDPTGTTLVIGAPTSSPVLLRPLAFYKF